MTNPLSIAKAKKCPSWEYNTVPKHGHVIAAAVAALVVDLRTRRLDSLDTARDTRPSHERMFAGLAPEKQRYYAGHYRGEEYICLKFQSVGVQGDPRVGCPPQLVSAHMGDLHKVISQTVLLLDQLHLASGAVASREMKLAATVAVTARAMEMFMRIHPYMNGNGHCGRLLAWCIMGRYGYWPARCTIEPRPTGPAYIECLKKHRDGEPRHLEEWLIQSLTA